VVEAFPADKREGLVATLRCIGVDQMQIDLVALAALKIDDCIRLGNGFPRVRCPKDKLSAPEPP